MKNLTLSIIPALVIVAALLAFYPVFTRGYFGEEINQPDTSQPEKGQSVSYEELQLAIDTTTVDTNEPTIVRFFLADFGGPFNIVHGLLLPNPTVSDPDYKPIIWSGTGQVVDLEDETTSRRIFYMNLHYSQEHAEKPPYDYWHDGRIAQISLDLSTLKGSFWMVGTDYNAARDQFSEGYDKFNLTVVGELPECLKEPNVPDDDSDGTDLEVPILTGTWDVELEFYEASSSPGVYGSGSLVLVITEQTRQVFTGYIQEPGDPYVNYINGAVAGRSIRIGGYDISFTGTLDPNEIIGTYSNIPLASDDDDYETGTFIARKQME